ncbi:Transcriptional regulator PadR-like family protein [Rhodococcus sp. AD45]|nr:Transcriptional regulator PadR-like family protein [Rhodococcus sp. AD45]
MLGMLTFGEELSGTDLKKWADWSVGFYYWSPSLSQVYTELKKLETVGFVQSREISEWGERTRRVYGITQSGVDAVRIWSRESPVEFPVLKHGVMLRLWMGHLNDPDHLKAIVCNHIANVEEKMAKATQHADHSEGEPGWAFSKMSLRWAARHFQAEIDLAYDLLEEIDEAAELFAQSRVDELGLPTPVDPGIWKSVDDEVRKPQSD